jgi:hypothetical protein
MVLFVASILVSLLSGQGRLLGDRYILATMVLSEPMVGQQQGLGLLLAESQVSGSVPE